MRGLSFLLLLGVTLQVYSDGGLPGEKEYLGFAQVGLNSNQVTFSSDESGVLVPLGPIVDRAGILYFYPQAGPNARKQLLKVEKNTWIPIPIPTSLKGTGWGSTVQQFTSNQGAVSSLLNGKVFSSDMTNPILSFDEEKAKLGQSGSPKRFYILPSGTYVETIGEDGVASGTLWDKNASLASTPNKVKSLLESQRPWFSIDETGHLQKQGMLWSAISPEDWSGALYLGKLASGHSVWAVGTPGMESWFLVTNAESKIELEVYFPWRFDGNSETNRIFSYSLGPWGEFYSLIAPEQIEIGTEKSPEGQFKPHYEVDPKGQAELVVVRNHLRYFGRLNDGGIRLRKDPSTTGEILGTYPLKTGFRILEIGTKQETIGGQKNVWYKVRLLDGNEGWFFGAFVQNLYDGPNGKSPPWPNQPDW